MRILSTVRLTNTQKEVIATIMSAATPKVAGEQISKSQQMCTARDILVKLGLITYFNGDAKLTSKGEQLAQEENIEPGGEVPPGGDMGEQPQMGDINGEPGLGGPAPEQEMGDPGLEGMPPMESYKFIKEVSGTSKPLYRKVAKKDIAGSEYRSFATFFKSI